MSGDNHILGVIAPKGRGKTYDVSREIASRNRVAIFDLTCEPQYAILADEIVIGDLPGFARALKDSTLARIVYRPIEYNPETMECDEFNWFCKLSFLHGQLTVIVEEAHLFCSAHRIPPDLMLVARLGRHRELSIIYITQSFAAISRALTDNTNTFWFYANFSPRELEAIGVRCGEDVSQAVQQLTPLDIPHKIAGDRVRWEDSGEWIIERGLKTVEPTKNGERENAR